MRRLLLLLCFPYVLVACALCALYTPSATVDITFVEENQTLNTMTMQWHFSEDFIQELKTRYDTNHNNLLDPNELERIQTILDAYVSKKEYLTHLELISTNDHVTKIPLHNAQKSFQADAGKLSFTFSFILSQPLKEGDELCVSLEDSQGYFKFLIHSFENKLASFAYTTSNAYNHLLFIKLASSTSSALAPSATKPQQHLAPPPAQKSWLEIRLAHLQEQIKALIASLNNEHSFMAYALFLGVSFLYGLFHAAGPGHGKALVGSYFLSSKQNYAKALYIAILIGFVHTFSAFLLTLVLHLFFDLFFKTFFDNFAYYATKASALIILGIAVYLLFKTLKRSRKTPKMISFSAHPPRCSCASCSEKPHTTDLGVILSAGIVPCPGTVTIFIFALSSGEYLFGFLSALFMGFGMSFIIALTASGTLFAQHRFLKNSTQISTYAHYLSLCMMFLLGGILLFG